MTRPDYDTCTVPELLAYVSALEAEVQSLSAAAESRPVVMRRRKYEPRKPEPDHRPGTPCTLFPSLR